MRGLILCSLLAIAAGCGGAGAFALSADDNNPVALARAFALEKRPLPGAPMNATGKPTAYFVALGSPKRLIAWDLAAGKTAWSVEANVTSRIAVGRDLVAHREGNDTIVARDVHDGRLLWSAGLGNKTTFLGLAADVDRVYYVVQDDSRKRTWFLVALQGGRELWRAEAPGTLGAPAARGGLVFMPFMTQWLTILDALSGKQVARIRQSDEAISFVRTTPEGVYYGSRGSSPSMKSQSPGTRER